jgi:hypothetical protein
MDPEDLAGQSEAPVQANRLAAVWDDVVADMEATAEQYREDGWAVVEVHAGHVTPLDGSGRDRWGLDVLAPDNEFAEVERLVLEEGHEFDSCEVFRARDGNLVLLVVAMLAEDAEKAVVFPAYYDEQGAADMLERAREAGQMRTHVRPLSEDPIVTFTQGDPSLFLPEAE